MTLRKVVWAEGMVLGQQHFQTWERYVEKSQHLLNEAAAPLGWGFSKLEIDEEALQAGVVRLSKCTAVFPCGGLVQFDATTSPPLSCTLTANNGGTVTVHLGLPIGSGVNGISGYSTEGQLCRWQANYQKVADQYDSSREREILLAHHNLSLFDAEVAGERFSLLKIAELIPEGDGGYKIAPDFIPTVSRIGASERLRGRVQRLSELFSAKAKVLKDRIRQQGTRIGDYGPNELSSFMLLQVLNPAAALLRHYHENSEIHPETLYRSLIGMASVLQCYSADTDLSDLPAYNHDDLSGVFKRLDALLRSLIDAVMPSTTMGMEFKRENELLYSVDSIDILLLEKSSFFLAVTMESDSVSWFSELPRKVKLGARADIEMIIASAMPGVTLTHTQRPPNRLPIKSGYEYFRIEPRGEFWERVVEERSMALFLTREFARAQIELVIIEE